MALKFRNVDAAPDDPVETWPQEGMQAALERGSLSDWGRIQRAVEQAPWGPVARSLEQVLSYCWPLRGGRVDGTGPGPCPVRG